MLTTEQTDCLYPKGVQARCCGTQSKLHIQASNKQPVSNGCRVRHDIHPVTPANGEEVGVIDQKQRAPCV
jgi:hypothetical protein